MKLNLMYEGACNTDAVNVLETFEIEPDNPDDRIQKVMKWLQDFIGH